MNKQEIVEKHIIDLIESGKFDIGDRVFSIREMARIHRTSPTPVIAAYHDLEMQGILESRPKSGFFVAPTASGGRVKKRPVYAKLFAFETDEQVKFNHRCSLLSHDPMIKYPFASTELPQSFRDSATIANLLRKSLPEYTSDGENFSNRNSFGPLTEAVSKWLESFKLMIAPSEICISGGLMPSLTLALSACVGRGDAVAVESPGNSHYYFAAKLYGIEIVNIPSDIDEGLDMDAFEAAARANPRLRCLICAPNFSSPTGAFMPMENRRRLVEFCDDMDITIIEDDTAGDFGFGMARPAPIKSLSMDNVIYICGQESSIINLNYISGGKWHTRITGLWELSQGYVPILFQRAFAQYLGSPQSRKHIKSVQKRLREARETVISIVEDSFPQGTRVSHPKGGKFVWVELPGELDTLSLLNDAQEYCISYFPGPNFSFAENMGSCLRLNCAYVTEPGAANALRMLGVIATRLVNNSQHGI